VLGVLGTHSLEELRQAQWVAASLESVAVTVHADRLDFCFKPAS
jgi:mannitol-1-/sugar-/sorbitol-6-phosphatase